MGSRCYCGGSCILPIIIGIIAGVLAVVFSTVFTAIVPFLWIAFGVSLLFLALLLGIVLFSAIIGEENSKSCLCRNGKCLLVGIFGTLITSVITLTLATLTGLLGTILTFLVVGFFFWMVIAFLLLINCIIDIVCD